MIQRLLNNPTLIVGFVEAILALGVAFGLDLTVEQTGSIIAALVALFAVLNRALVYGPKTVERVKAEARKEGAESALDGIYIRPQL